MPNKLLLLLAAALIATPAFAQQTPQQTVEPGDIAAMQAPDGNSAFTLITPQGFVGFEAGDWVIAKLKGGLPADFTFEIPDKADQNTEESTELSIDLYDPDSRAGRDALGGFGKSVIPAGRPKKEDYNGWTVVTQNAVAKGTPYTLMDAEATQGDVIVVARLAWPHLIGQSGTYNADMRALMLRTLDTLKPGSGAYALHPGEVVRHPAEGAGR